MNDKYYSLEVDECLKKLETNSNTGLSKKEVLKRQNKYGKNELPKKKKDSIIKIFFNGFKDPIEILLLITAIISFCIGEYFDGAAILFIILVDVIMGTVQEYNAGKNADSLANMIKYKVKVIRDSEECEIDSTDLTIGDIVLLESGDKASCDMRLIEEFNLQVDESALTGESVNINKITEKLDEDCILAERKNMVFAGSPIVTGRAKAVVVGIGINTEIGKIAKTISEMEDEKSPLAIRMEKLSKQITKLLIVIAAIITVILFVKGYEVEAVFMNVIALTVSAMPEGLPLALTMALTISSNKMSKKNVIVKKLNYVESLGSCTVIATDKTGTLTVNEQTAKLISLPNGKNFKVDGTGYNFDGKIKGANQYTDEICLMGFLNNESTITKKNKNYHYYGDSIDIAFKVLKEKSTIKEDDYEVLKRIPYESENKYSAVFYKYKNKTYCTVKGSLEKVMEFSTHMQESEHKVKIDKEYLTEQNEALAGEGYRVIAVATGECKNFVIKDYYDTKDIPELNFLGMVSFIDPIRVEVKDAIKKCYGAGIKVVMITGDHPLTAYSIGKELNLVKEKDEVTTGVELNKYYELGEKEFDEFVKGKHVFARVTPMDKLHIVESLKRMGEFVAVTGDGVNDAPAIKAANIGIAMGSGTDVAKETASMIIIDDNFKSIVAGIEEGRGAYSNIRKVSGFLLGCGVAEVLFFVLAIVCNMPVPLVAIQLLWLNLVTDGLQDVALSCEKVESGVMNKPPIDTKETIFNKELIQEILISGLTITALVFGLWVYLLKGKNMQASEELIAHARVYIMALMVFIQNVHVLNCRSESKSFWNFKLKDNPILALTVLGSIGLQIIMMETPIGKFLKIEDGVPIPHLLGLLTMSFFILVVFEIYKRIKNEKNKA